MQSIKATIKELPDQPGVYLFKDISGEVVYVGRATSLRDRVRSYFSGQLNNERPIERMIEQVVSIDHLVTPTVIESVILEANEIKSRRPKYNVMLRDDKSFAYLAVTREQYPRLKIVRGRELGLDWFVSRGAMPKKFKKLYGPFGSARLIETALKLLRNIFPYSTCKAGSKRSCLYYQMGKCPGVCIGEVTPRQYTQYLRPYLLLFGGKKSQIIKELENQMKAYSKAKHYEAAAAVRDQLYRLEHIQDIALIQKQYAVQESYNPIMGRVEAYDISNISGEYATGSMVVFEAGEASKSDYRKFKIKTVKGSSDVAMMEEVVRRRVARDDWPLPDVFVIDGGKPQVNRVHSVIQEAGIDVPIIGIAKGPTRKKSGIIQIGGGAKLARLIRAYLSVLLAARDESHRFAVQYHRKRRRKRI